MSSERKVVLLLVGGFLVMSLISGFPGPDIKDVVRFLLNCVFCWFLWKGANRARWVMGVRAIPACVLGAIVLLRIPMRVEAMVPLVVMTLFYGFAAYVLLSLHWVTSHFMAEAPDQQLQPIARDDPRAG